MNSMQKKLRRYISEKLGVDEEMVKDDSSFTEDLAADSLDVFELFAGIEKEFGVIILDEQAEKIKTMKGLNNYILKQIAVHS